MGLAICTLPVTQKLFALLRSTAPLRDLQAADGNLLPHSRLCPSSTFRPPVHSAERQGHNEQDAATQRGQFPAWLMKFSNISLKSMDKKLTKHPPCMKSQLQRWPPFHKLAEPVSAWCFDDAEHYGRSEHSRALCIAVIGATRYEDAGLSRSPPKPAAP